MWIGEVAGPGPAYRCVEREIPQCADAGICERGTCTYVNSRCGALDGCYVCTAVEVDSHVCL